MIEEIEIRDKIRENEHQITELKSELEKTKKLCPSPDEMDKMYMRDVRMEIAHFNSHNKLLNWVLGD